MDVFLVVLFLATLVTFLLLLYYQGQFFRLLLKGLYAKHRKLVPLTVGLLAYGVGLLWTRAGAFAGGLRQPRNKGKN